eukprot:evm.model.scf_314EXC.5 EVM.evm.TU.scf_314EXC.5   scf_314EXC:26620-28021(+)
MDGVSRRPKVAVAVLVTRGAKVLVGQRKGGTGDGEWALPGGHLEYGESFEECGERELLEETGLKLEEAAFVWAISAVVPSGPHYAVIFVRGTVPQEVEAENREPEKCFGWRWIEWPHVPEPVFPPLRQFINSQYKFTPQDSCGLV